MDHDGPAGLFPAGYHLRNALGDAYLAITATGNHGQIAAGALDADDPTGFQYTEHQLPEAQPVSIEAAFDTTAALTIADLRAARPDIDDAAAFQSFRQNDHFPRRSGVRRTGRGGLPPAPAHHSAPLTTLGVIADIHLGLRVGPRKGRVPPADLDRQAPAGLFGLGQQAQGLVQAAVAAGGQVAGRARYMVVGGHLSVACRVGGEFAGEIRSVVIEPSGYAVLSSERDDYPRTRRAPIRFLRRARL